MATDLGIHLVPQAGVAPSQVWAEAGETLGNPTTRGGSMAGYTRSASAGVASVGLGFLTIVGNPGLTPWAP